MILAVDTCLGASSVAILDGDRVLAALSEPMTRGHQERLPPLVQAAMAQAGAPFSALTRIGVTIGPGSFTGLRVGLAFAKGLSVALSIPCVGVGSLAALAASDLGGGFKVAAVDARKDQLYVQIFDGSTPLMAPDVLPVATVAARIAELHGGQPAVFIGSGAPLLEGVISGARILDLAAADPVAVARLAAAAPATPPRPLYLRPPYANLPAPAIHAPA
jgi:tRNA threonylcarbamoyladenosine biosynthesis protein TsaB